MTPKIAFIKLTTKTHDEYDEIEDKQMIDIVLDALTELEVIKRYPTSDEVCKALSEELNHVVTFHDNRFTGNDEVICYTWKFPNGDINLVFDYEILPPHLITLIGRFYEGLEKVCDDE